MFNYLRLTTVSTGLVLLSPIAFSTAWAQQDRSKVSVGYTLATVDAADLGLITLRYNYSLNEYFALEGDVGFGVTDDDLDLGDEFDGVFVPIASETSADFGGGLFAVGNGGNYFFTPQHGIRLDYTYYNAEIDFEDFEFSGSDAVPISMMGGEEEVDVDQFSIAYVFQF
ncbi:MAG: outer membrane beta-barrel protein [Pseudomonadota bacterium]